ncbi:sigma-70 family RNA polymerase sigma factor [bacterium]|nr:sigma-70 family RNA polymerase sigma factor [bacterium]MCB2179193.1 sigma-70 family RNA polymerase sigma factor [bacterium]
MHTAELDWLKRAQKGDDLAFARLVEVYQKPVYNLCYRMLGNAGDAEDAAQETFIRAYKAIRRYDPERKFSTWLLSIASNYCIDQHRRRKLPTFSYDALDSPNIPSKSAGMESMLVQDEHQARVTALLETLKPKDKAVIVMRYWHEYSYEEIAEALSMSVSAVKSRLHRARKELADVWIDAEQDSIKIERTHYEQTTA